MFVFVWIVWLLSLFVISFREHFVVFRDHHPPNKQKFKIISWLFTCARAHTHTNVWALNVVYYRMWVRSMSVYVCVCSIRCYYSTWTSFRLEQVFVARSSFRLKYVCVCVCKWERLFFYFIFLNWLQFFLYFLVGSSMLDQFINKSFETKMLKPFLIVLCPYLDVVKLRWNVFQNRKLCRCDAVCT